MWKNHNPYSRLLQTNRFPRYVGSTRFEGSGAKVLVSPLHLITVISSVWIVLPEETDIKKHVSVQQAITIEERSRMQDFEVLLTRIINPPEQAEKAALTNGIIPGEKKKGVVERGMVPPGVQVRIFFLKL